MNVSELKNVFFSHLRSMDEEANSSPIWNGIEYETGLREYARHVQSQNDPKYQYELVVCDELSNRLNADGIVTHREVRYPGRSTKVDLAVALPVGDSIWIEVKYAWTYNIHPTVNRNSNYGAHLFGNSKKSLARDFQKLQHAPSSIVGVLLLGFDIAPNSVAGLQIEAAHIERVFQVAETPRHDWIEAYEEWSDNNLANRTNGGGRVRCWFWHRMQPKAQNAST